MSPATRVRWAVGIVVVVLGASVGAILVALALRPGDPNGYGPSLERAVVGACTRSAPGVDRPEDACRCAYRHLAATMPFDRFRQLDDELRKQGHAADELVTAVKACGVTASP
jgi:hypothetical protein